MKDRKHVHHNDAQPAQGEANQEQAVPSKEEPSLTANEIQVLKKKEIEYNSVWDKYLRICAEFDNARKRWDREREELAKFSNLLLLRELIVINDELEHALMSFKNHKGHEAIEQGVALTYNKLIALLKKEGVASIEAAGKKFDPHIHEIVGQKESADEFEHVVLIEVQKGYMLADKVLRTSKVIIGIKKKTEDSSQKSECEAKIEEKEEDGNKNTGGIS
jgi:molecular chaperone GrpE